MKLLLILLLSFIAPHIIHCTIVTFQACRKEGGAGGLQPPQFFADQLTLSQPGGVDYAHLIILAPPDFQTFLRPCS